MNIVLIGFMGSGKSTVGRLLSEYLRCDFYDLDELILDKTKCSSISEIFDKIGEDYFREIERNIFVNLFNSESSIISTGGGIITNNNVLDEVKYKSQIIYLETDLDIIKKRISNFTDRPLFKNPKEIQNLFEHRKPFYEKFANLKINTNLLNPQNVVDEIINFLKN
ncbi:MAG: shikimate kinase [Bacteroidetes bacterium]|nr:shikimate kinase [Bacteroidota bacterium]